MPKPARLLCLVTVVLSVVSACADGGRPTSTAAGARPPKPALRLVAITDLSGYLAPCGCQSRPLGGIDKAARKLAELHADGVPTLFVAAGDLLLGEVPDGGGQAADATTQEVWKAETLVDVLNRLELRAAAPGPRDLSYGADTFTKLRNTARFRTLPETGSPNHAAAARWLTSVGGLKVGVVGASTFANADAELDIDSARAFTQSVQSEADALHTEGADLVVALVSSTQRAGRRLAAALHGVDFLVQGGIDEADVPTPSLVGGTVVLRAGRQGHGLLVVDIYPRHGASTAFIDVSEWKRRGEEAALRARVDELQKQITTWSQDKSVDHNDLQEQQKKLAALRAELAKKGQKSLAVAGSFDARFEELGAQVQGDPQVLAAMGAYDARVNEHNRKAFADLLPPPVPKGAAHYVGSAACKDCHTEAYAWWSGHAHGRAYATLVDLHKEFNLSCVGCHVTGYAKPGGSTVVHNEGLVNVGCESCHGAGSEHIRAVDGGPPQAITRTPGEEVCKHCHTPEHSDLFQYATYRKRLTVPGHGLPAKAAAEPVK